MPATAIEFVSDVVCPWCFIGLHRLETALAETGTDAEITFRPFQLDPTTPREGVDLRERLAQKYGADPEMMFRRVEAAARESGLVLDFSKVRRHPNTLFSHTLIGKAAEKKTQGKLARALFEAHFQRGLDLSDVNVLVELASSHGFTADEATSILHDEGALAATRQEARAFAEQGVTGVPFIIFNGALAVSGAQPVSVFKQVIERAQSA